MGKHIMAALIAIVAIGLFAFLRQVHADSFTYTVHIGDSLSSIAQKQLGDANKWIDIFNDNKDQISNPNTIYAGEVLTLPNVSSGVVPVTFYAPDQGQNVVVQNVTVQQVPIYEHVAIAQKLSKVVVTTLKGSANYASMIQAAANQYHVDATVMNTVIACESGFNPNAYNASSGATGIAQYLPSTWASENNPFRAQSIYDPYYQINYMALMISRGDAHAWQCYTMHY